MFGFGIYSSPDIAVAEMYTQTFNWKKKSYKLILQNRVNPNTLQKIDTKYGAYWLSPSEADFRMYGILIKKVKEI